ncbi:hypothetical protein HOC01_04545 [archaeon]|nr:hypothetical protein [archaeon]MBT6698235.1 hypothetical protein [archaeon]
MAVIQAKIKCFTCGDGTPKNETVLVDRYGMGTVYECYPCFKSSRGTTLRMVSEERKKVKQDLFCGACRYKFSSRKAVCPYCGSSDALSSSNVSASDLI